MARVPSWACANDAFAICSTGGLSDACENSEERERMGNAYEWPIKIGRRDVKGLELEGWNGANLASKLLAQLV